jgi:hypothetical protein
MYAIQIVSNGSAHVRHCRCAKLHVYSASYDVVSMAEVKGDQPRGNVGSLDSLCERGSYRYCSRTLTVYVNSV